MQGVHLVTGEALDHGRRVQAVRAALGNEPVLVGLSAAWAHRCRIAGAADLVHISSAQHHRRAHVVAHRFSSVPADVVMMPFRPTTSAARTAVDLARGVGATRFLDRVAAVDALLRDTRVRVADVRADMAERRYLAGIREASRCSVRRETVSTP